MERDVIDIASLILYPEGPSDSSGQLTASLEEILSVLRHLLAIFDHSTLIFDGIDECADQSEFFRCLQDITSIIWSSQDDAHVCLDKACPDNEACLACTSATCKVVLSSRPTIRIPRFVSSRCTQLRLRSEQNLNDIIAYLYPRMQDLIDEGLLDESLDSLALSKRAANYANGMFLWATYLIEYLQCEALTIGDRVEALNNLVRLEGLDALYGAILRDCCLSLPTKARSYVGKAFRWVAGALRPMYIEEIGPVIFSSSKDIGNSTSSAVANLEDTLVKMSGALLEVASDRTVGFVHISMKEYLYYSPSNLNVPPPVEFRLQKGQVHRSIASYCLSYFNHRMPPEPLSGSSQMTASAELVAREYCLLRYCVQFWSAHCVEGLLDENLDLRQDSSYYELVSQFDAFITNRRCITAWIEVSWLFGIPPNLGRLPTLRDTLNNAFRNFPDDFATLKHLASRLVRLSEDLHRLNSSWGQVLATTPNEIWEPSVAAFTPSEFWINTNKATMAKVSTEKDLEEMSIITQSRVSSNGHEIGLVKLVVPR